MANTVLIVDDSLTVRMDLSASFQNAGFETLLAAAASEAREVLSRASVSLIVLDVMLPDADGLELLQEFKKTTNAPVLLLSSEADVRDRIRGLSTGADDYVGKPYDADYLVARSCELLRVKAGRQNSGTVLLVDDSPTFRSALQNALELEGHTVIAAHNGEEGLRLAASHRPAMIVVDDIMPGLDGVSVIRRLRLDAAMRGTLCVLLTGSTPGSEVELRALDSGADAFVRKEEDLPLILARLSAVLRRSQRNDSTASSLLGPKRILAADDSDTYLHALSATLRGEGYDVVLAHSGQEALEMLAVQSIDCVLLDLEMPGLGGTETCQRIKSAPGLREIPLIILTSRDDPTAMLESLSNGADDFVSKSSELEVIKARVRAQLRRKQFEDEHRKVREELLRTEMHAAEERSARQLAEAKAMMVEELERKNRELESFSYSISHDLRAPLRSIDGFSLALLEDAQHLDEGARANLNRVRAAAQRMSSLIDALLKLSRVAQHGIVREKIDIASLASDVFDDLKQREPEREVQLAAPAHLPADADEALVRAVLDNLIGNAWKFTKKVSGARIEVGERDGAYYVRDNGAGFDMAFAAKLFTPFQRLHREAEFPGTGIGLATVARIVDRHGGRVWAEASVGHGATFLFTLKHR